MHLTHLRLTDFRSYAALDIALDGRPVVLFGANGAGKTNLLEALSLLTPGRGLRRASPESFLRQEGSAAAQAWGIGAALSDDTETQLNIGCLPGAARRREIRIDGSKQTGPRLAEYISALWLTPAQDRLFTGPAGDRRKFLDRMCLAHFPAHGRLSIRYDKARADRNRLLSDGLDDAGWYGALEAEMASCGALIAKARVDTVDALSAELDSRPESAFPKALLHLDGDIEALFIAGADEADAEDHFIKELAARRGKELRAGRSLYGVHKSDLQVTHAPKTMPAEYCSTGEQKALLIALVLAHARALSERHPNRALMLLLDEVAAHLDEHRRAALADELCALPAHIFMTGTDALLFEAFSDRAQRFEVSESVLTGV